MQLTVSESEGDIFDSVSDIFEIDLHEINH